MLKRNQYIVLVSVMSLLIIYFVPLWQITLKKSMVDVLIHTYTISSFLINILENKIALIFIISLSIIIFNSFYIILKKSIGLLKVSLIIFIVQFTFILLLFFNGYQYFKPENSFYYTEIYQLSLLGCTFRNSVHICMILL